MRTIIIAAILFVAAVFYIVYPAIFYLGVFVGIIYIIVCFSRAKCPTCGTRGSLKLVGTESWEGSAPTGS